MDRMRYHYISLKVFCGDFRVTVPGTSIGSSSAPAEYMDRMRYHYIGLKVYCGDFRVTVPGTSIGSSSAPAEYMDRMRYHYISLKVFCGDFRMSFSRKQHWLPVPLANIGGSAGRGGLSNPSKTIIIYIYMHFFSNITACAGLPCDQVRTPQLYVRTQSPKNLLLTVDIYNDRKTLS